MKNLILIFPFLCFCSSLSIGQSKYIDSLQQIVDLQKKDTVEIKALLDLAHEYSRKDSDKAKSYVYQALAVTQSQGLTYGRGGAFGYLVTLHQNSGRLDSATYYLSLSEGNSKNSSNIKVKINYYQTAGLFYKNQGQYTKALPFMIQAHELNKVKDENYAGQLLNIGNTYFSLSDFKTAVKYHLQALSLFEKLNNKRGQSFCLQNLGNNLFKLRQFDQSQDYFQRSIKLKEELKDKRGLINGWTGLGDVYKEKNQFDLSEKYYLRALEAAKEMKLILEEARCNNQLGLLYRQMGLLAKSQTALTTGLALARQSGDSSMSAVIHSELLAIAVQEQKEKRTENTLLSNLTTHINSGDRGSEATEYSHLAEYYAANNKFDIAFGYLKKHEQLKDSVEGNAVLLQIKELEEQFQSEKKEKEIALLKKDQELQALALSRERTNVALIAFALISVLIISILLVNRYRVKNRTNRLIELERMRNSIARDLHDDIGSTLSSINIMSQLALNENGNTSQQHLKKIAIHSAQMMENMSDIVWSINPKNDLAEQMVFKMKEFAAEILEPAGINYSFHVEGALETLKLDSEKRKNLFLIFKEAINNAAKYSGGTTVTINLFLQFSHLHLEIVDNGKGFNKEEAKHGNGLSNMKDRATAISGALQYNTEPGKGTRIILAVPIT